MKHLITTVGGFAAMSITPVLMVIGLQVVSPYLGPAPMINRPLLVVATATAMILVWAMLCALIIQGLIRPYDVDRQNLR